MRHVPVPDQNGFALQAGHRYRGSAKTSASPSQIAGYLSGKMPGVQIMTSAQLPPDWPEAPDATRTYVDGTAAISFTLPDSVPFPVSIAVSVDDPRVWDTLPDAQPQPAPPAQAPGAPVPGAPYPSGASYGPAAWPYKTPAQASYREPAASPLKAVTAGLGVVAAAGLFGPAGAVVGAASLLVGSPDVITGAVDLCGKAVGRR